MIVIAREGGARHLRIGGWSGGIDIAEQKERIQVLLYVHMPELSNDLSKAGDHSKASSYSAVSVFLL